MRTRRGLTWKTEEAAGRMMKPRRHGDTENLGGRRIAGGLVTLRSWRRGSSVSPCPGGSILFAEGEGAPGGPFACLEVEVLEPLELHLRRGARAARRARERRCGGDDDGQHDRHRRERGDRRDLARRDARLMGAETVGGDGRTIPAAAPHSPLHLGAPFEANPLVSCGTRFLPGGPRSPARFLRDSQPRRLLIRRPAAGVGSRGGLPRAGAPTLAAVGSSDRMPRLTASEARERAGASTR